MAFEEILRMVHMVCDVRALQKAKVIGANGCGVGSGIPKKLGIFDLAVHPVSGGNGNRKAWWLSERAEISIMGGV